MRKVIGFISALLLVCFAAIAEVHTFDHLSLYRSSQSGLQMASVMTLASEDEPVDGLLREYSYNRGLRLMSASSLSSDASSLRLGDTVIFNLFDDVCITGTVSCVRGDAYGAVYSASMDGLDCMTLIETDDGLLVNAQHVSANRVYTIVPTENMVVIREYVPPPTACADGMDALELSSENVAGGISFMSAEVSEETSADEGEPTLIDILVVYDAGAHAWVNQYGAGMTNFARSAVAKMNNALSNSELDDYFNFRLVGVTNVAVTETDIFDGNDDSLAGINGWEGVPELRTALGADIVTVLIDTGSAYGDAGVSRALNSAPISDHSETGYNCCAIRTVAIAHIMTHEVGHNLGAGHSDKQAFDPGPQWGDEKPYSCGYYFTGTDDVAYYTVMGYNSDGYGGYYIEAPFFSSPLITYQGVAAGTVASNDNARVLRETYAEASQWRAQVLPVTYGVSFSPEDRTIFTESITVTLTPELPELEVYYTLDGTVPTTSSALYTGPITLTQATTISAITWDGKNASPIYTAIYHLSDLGNGLDAPQFSWTTEGDVDWEFQTTDIHDGMDAVGSTWTTTNQISYLSATISGPTDLSFWYATRKHKSEFSVLIDDEAVFSDTKTTYGDEWSHVLISIPTGSHLVKFAFENNGGYYDIGDYGFAVVDEISFDKYSYPPEILPETSDTLSTAMVFTGKLEVAISSLRGGEIYYTTDMSMPTTSSTRYTGPFDITESTLVSAITVQENSEPSPPVTALYVERHKIEPGEWTTDIDQAEELAAENDGKIITLLANIAGDDYCRIFAPIVEGEEFCSWARVNKIYLVTADISRYPDAEDAYYFFFEKWVDFGLGLYGYPTLLMTSGDGSAEGVLYARVGSGVNSIIFDGTLDSLIECMGSFLETQFSVAAVPVPYTWIEQYYGIQECASDYNERANSDSDGDGFTTWQEYLCGTDPTDTDSRFEITISVVDGKPVIDWNVSNSELATYTIQGTSDLAKPFTAPVDDTHRFFRVVVTPSGANTAGNRD